MQIYFSQLNTGYNRAIAVYIFVLCQMKYKSCNFIQFEVTWINLCIFIDIKVVFIMVTKYKYHLKFNLC